MTPIERAILDDIEFGYDLSMIKGKIKNGSYCDSDSCEPSRPVIISTKPKAKAKAPKIGSHISVYALDLNRAVSMEVFDVRGNTLSCGFEDLEYTVRLQPTGENDYRWEGEVC